MQRERARALLIPGLVTTLAQLRDAMQAGPVTLETLPDDSGGTGSPAMDGHDRSVSQGRRQRQRDATSFRHRRLAIAPEATGAPVSIQEWSHAIVRRFCRPGVWALLAITVFLALTLRRAIDVVLTLVPIAAVGDFTLGICAAVGLRSISKTSSRCRFCSASASHSISISCMAWRAGGAQLLQSSLTRAVIFSALTTGTAFGSLWLSRHPGTASMGELLALSLACTLVAALLFLPALLGEPPPRR